MLCLTKKQAEEIIAHCKRESPYEACGILAGKTCPEPVEGACPERSPELVEGRSRRRKRVTRVYPMTNTDKSAETFFMDPKEQLRVIKEIRNSELEMVGIYHSHPETEAYPSAHDVELAFYPEAAFVIVSIKDKDSPSIRSFRIVEGKIKEEVLTIQ